MDLGNAQLEWFSYVPVFNGNRELPPEEQLRLDIRRMRSIDRMDQLSWGEEGAMHTWRDQTLQKYLQDDDVGPLLRRVPTAILVSLRQFTENTRNFENFVIDGEVQADPVEIFFHISASLLEEGNLLAEINAAIVRAAVLSGDELKNFKGQCDGSRPLESTAAPASSESALPSAATPSATSAG